MLYIKAYGKEEIKVEETQKNKGVISKPVIYVKLLL